MTEIDMGNFSLYEEFSEFEEIIGRKKKTKKERNYFLHPERYKFGLRDLK
ncbi:MAG: hypothetical protein ACFFDH_03485 [Promethearchaeota archaeon]